VGRYPGGRQHGDACGARHQERGERPLALSMIGHTVVSGCARDRPTTAQVKPAQSKNVERGLHRIMARQPP
jgi:hypothetical protein